MEIECFAISSTFRIVEVDGNGDCCRTFRFSELAIAVSQVESLLNVAKNNLVLLSLPKSAAAVAVIFGVLKSGNVFTCMSASNAELDLKEREHRKAWCLISATLHSAISVDIFGTTVFFTFFKPIQLPVLKGSKNCYSMQTSGTTGMPKEIIVPYSAIMPNVHDFCLRFEVIKSDIISFSTALIFDPSIIELFIAASVGCSLLIIPDNKRVQPSQFGKILIKNAVTFLQITPSALMLFSPDLLQKLLEETSFLRILLIGGERFPVNFLRRFYTSRSTTKLYNVYGLTEVSCWASCRAVDYATLIECDDIDIGVPIKDTLLQVSESNELLVHGRTCVIDGDLRKDWLHTGDLVKVDDEGKIYISGRITNQIKLNGIRLNLNEIESYVSTLDGIDSCVVMAYMNSLIMFVKSNITEPKKLQQFLSSKWRCHAIVNIQRWPLTDHGKVDRNMLLEHYRQSNKASTIDDIGKIFANFGIDILRDRKLTFSELGFTSFKATELMLQIQHLLIDSEFSVVQYVLSSNGTVEGLLGALFYSQCTINSELPNVCTHCNDGKETFFVVDSTNNSAFCWQENMEKCIDATPVLSNNSVIVGSHSGRLVSLSLVDGRLQWERRLQDRIEGTVAVENGTIVVGCYDHNVYFLHEENGIVFWKFMTNDIVKSKAKFIGDGQCLMASYDQQLHLLDYKKCKVIWSTFCGGTIAADIVIHKGLIIAASLAATILTFEKDTGCKLSESKCIGPFFASPCLLERNAILVACDVKGTIYSFNVTLDGLQQKNTVRIDEAIFAAPLMINDDYGIVMTQNASMYFFTLNPLNILRHLQSPEFQSGFVRPPVIIEDKIFFLNITGQLFVINFLAQYISKASDTKTDLTIGDDVCSSSLDTAVKHRPTLKLNSPNVVDILRSQRICVQKIISVDAETFGGITVVPKDNASGEYFIIIGYRDDYLRCFSVILQ